MRGKSSGFPGAGYQEEATLCEVPGCGDMPHLPEEHIGSKVYVSGWGSELK